MKAIIFLNGVLEAPLHFAKQPEETLIIAADGGAKLALELAYEIDYIIGDLDSLSKDDLKNIKNAKIIKYPVEKDEIDFELAINLALEKGVTAVDVLGAFGGRWDMFLANMFLPAVYFEKNIKITFWHGSWSIQVLKGPKTIELTGEKGDNFSLIPLASNILGINLLGAKYPLNNETLKIGTSRGLSNAFQEEKIKLSFQEGALLFVKGVF